MTSSFYAKCRPLYSGLNESSSPSTYSLSVSEWKQSPPQRLGPSVRIPSCCCLCGDWYPLADRRLKAIWRGPFDLQHPKDIELPYRLVSIRFRQANQNMLMKSRRRAAVSETGQIGHIIFIYGMRMSLCEIPFHITGPVCDKAAKRLYRSDGQWCENINAMVTSEK